MKKLKAESGKLELASPLPTMAGWLMGFSALLLALAARAQWSEPVLVDTPWDTLGVNTPTKEWCPFVTADGQYLYFTREHTNNDLYVCQRTDSGWSHPHKLPFCTEIGDERNPSVNATNDTLYYVVWSGGWDLFWSFRTGPCDTCWGPPERLPEPINSSGIEFSVWCMPDNQRLLFSSWRSGGAGGEDIYQCRRDATSPTGWGAPSPLPGHANTWGGDSYPSMGFDTTELFYWQDDSYLYVTQLSDSGWQRGERLPHIINRVIIRDPSEITPAITPDGRRLYFASRWSDSVATAGDIWYSERPLSVPDQAPRAQPQGFACGVHPNPFNSTTTLRFALPVPSEVKLTLYDVTGRVVMARELGWLAAGEHAERVEAKGLASGIYFVSLRAGTRSVVRKVALVR